MKFKTTRKQIREDYKTIIQVGYCDLYYLLHYTEPMAYSTRAEGWACDYYELNNEIVISTGYAPIGKKLFTYDELRQIDTEAENIIGNYDLSYDEKKNAINTLISKFIEMVEART